jgi:hypothetical protein
MVNAIVPQRQRVRMSKNEVIVSLSRTALFGGLAADEIAVCGELHERHFAKGEMLFAQPAGAARQAGAAGRRILPGRVGADARRQPPQGQRRSRRVGSVGAIGRSLDRLSCDPAKLVEIARQDDV